MNRRKREAALRTASALCVGLLLVGLGGGPVAAQAITVEGDFAGTLGGYDDGGTDRPHVVTVEGEFTVTGENAQNVEVEVAPGNRMVLDQRTVEAFVEGDREVSFDQTNRGNRVILRTDEIPSGTTIQVNFETVYVGGTTTNELNAGSVTVSYETAGGTEGEESFDAPTDMSASADNRIGSLQAEINGTQNWRLIGIAGAAFGVIGIVGMVVLFLRGRDDGGPPGPSGPEL
ncbi:hypothetical protein [Haloglomus litoreum]|uniref:hypothetical protein n=1 Tax=Haloglomus litoreum TaxID=3034026 RepID=UPI0023E824DA|nr:hypothetical protein [Haloglomus sp. DT116]